MVVISPWARPNTRRSHAVRFRKHLKVHRAKLRFGLAPHNRRNRDLHRRHVQLLAEAYEVRARGATAAQGNLHRPRKCTNRSSKTTEAYRNNLSRSEGYRGPLSRHSRLRCSRGHRGLQQLQRRAAADDRGQTDCARHHHDAGEPQLQQHLRGLPRRGYRVGGEMQAGKMVQDRHDQARAGHSSKAKPTDSRKAQTSITATRRGLSGRFRRGMRSRFRFRRLPKRRVRQDSVRRGGYRRACKNLPVRLRRALRDQGVLGLRQAIRPRRSHVLHADGGQLYRAPDNSLGHRSLNSHESLTDQPDGMPWGCDAHPGAQSRRSSRTDGK